MNPEQPHLDLAAIYAQIVDELAAQRPIRISMERVTDACSAGFEHPDWKRLRALPFEDLAPLRAWLRATPRPGRRRLVAVRHLLHQSLRHQVPEGAEARRTIGSFQTCPAGVSGDGTSPTRTAISPGMAPAGSSIPVAVTIRVSGIPSRTCTANTGTRAITSS